MQKAPKSGWSSLPQEFALKINQYRLLFVGGWGGWSEIGGCG